MNVLFRTYQTVLMKYPVGAQAVQTGLLMGSGDLIAQVFVEQKSFSDINLLRTGQFSFIGTVFVGPSLRVWYGILEKYIGSKGKVTTLKKVAADQLLFAPTFLAVFMGVVGVVQGKEGNEIMERMKQDYPDILKSNYKLWPAVQLCNFYTVPLQYQVITVQLVAIIWNTYLSWKMNSSIPLRGGCGLMASSSDAQVYTINTNQILLLSFLENLLVYWINFKMNVREIKSVLFVDKTEKAI